MNLHSVVSGAVGSINPFVGAQMLVSLGHSTNAAGHRLPVYADPLDVEVQFQPLSYTDLQKISGLNLQGIVKTAYVNGNFEGVNRRRQKGGDQLIVNDEVWLIVQPLEEWPDWCKFVVNLQVNPA